MRFRVILSRYSSRLFPGLSDSHDQRRGPFKTPLSLLVPFFNIYFLRHFFRGCLYFFPGSKFVLSLSLSFSALGRPPPPVPLAGPSFFFPLILSPFPLDIESHEVSSSVQHNQPGRVWPKANRPRWRRNAPPSTRPLSGREIQNATDGSVAATAPKCACAPLS